MIAIVIATFALAAQTTPSNVSWEQSLKRERTSLRGEEAALQNALNASKKNTAVTVAAQEAALEALTARLVRLRAENESQRGTFAGRERDRQRRVSASAVVEVALRTQAWGLHRGLLSEKQNEPSPQSLKGMLQSLVDGLRKRAVVSMTQGQVFDDQGVGRRQQILQTGRVGAIALNETGEWATPVEPIFGELGWTHVGPAQRTKTVGTWVSLPVVLFDPDAPHDHAPEPARGVLGWLEAGGLAMYPLFLMGLIALLVSLERAFALLAAQRAWWKGAQTAGADWRAISSSATLNPAALRPVRVILNAPAGEGKERLEERAVEAILRLRTSLRTRLSILGVISAAAPLLGLLGTVTGMIGTFRVITEHGTGDPELLSGGISQALLTTQLGLAIAIPTLLSHAGLGRWAQRLVSRAEQTALLLIQSAPRDEDNTP